MEFQLDKSMKAMKIDEDKLLILPNQPNYCSNERNIMSLMGRLLNPENQKMSSFIHDMPRLWKVYDRVRGVALSKDRLQFIFKYEQDLNAVLKMGVWAHDD